MIYSRLLLLIVNMQCPGPGVGAAGAELLPRVLDKIFSSLVYEGAAPDQRRSRAVKNVRRHAAGLLVKLGSKVSDSAVGAPTTYILTFKYNTNFV